MDPVSRKAALTTSVVKGGQGNVARAAIGGTKNQVQSQETPVSPQQPKLDSSRVDAFGVETTTRADGTVAKKAQSGVELEVAQDGGRTLSFAGGESFRLSEDKIEVVGGEAKSAALVTNQEGIELLSFIDKSGHQVQVDPETLTYEVLNKRGDTAQVFHTDGTQDLVAFGTFRGPDGKHQEYEKRARFDQQGNLVENAGFEGLQARDGKISFQLGEGKVSRSLARSLPGQPPIEEPKTQETSVAASNSAPIALLAEDPVMLDSIASTSPPPAAQAPVAPTTTPGAKESSPELFPGLPKYGPGFFDPSGASEGVNFVSTPSGMTVRTEGNTRSFALPNGDMFRTDGTNVEVLGDAPRAKNARIVTEDGRQLLAYSDKNRNSYQLDVNNGNYSVTNPNGTLKQQVSSDGSRAFEARSTHTTEAGSKAHSFHRAVFSPDGALVEKQGFENLEVGEKSLVYTLPNGESSVKNLVEPTPLRYSEPKPDAPGVREGWGEAQSAFDAILGRSSVGGTPTAAPVTEAGDSASPTEMAKSGLSRTTLPDGSVMTRLPSGISFTDNGEQSFATDSDGNRLEVLRREAPTSSGYYLYTKSQDGVGYTISPDHLDMLVESKDGKVHQLVAEDGLVDTHIKDGPNTHVHQLDTNRMQQVASPGVRADIRTPNRLYIDSPDNRSYELPHPLPTMPAGPAPWGATPGGPPPGWTPGEGTPFQGGVKPSFWERLKGAFTGENPWEMNGPQGTQFGGFPGPGPYSSGPIHPSGMPGYQMRYDPVSQQIHEMERTTRMMNTLSMVNIGISSLGMLSFMPSMFYPFGGGFF